MHPDLNRFIFHYITRLCLQEMDIKVTDIFKVTNNKFLK